MELCSEKHDEVCFDGRRCPACASWDDLQDQLDDAEKELKQANAQIAALEEAADNA